MVERVTRIELALSAWEADVLPLNYTRSTGTGVPAGEIMPDSDSLGTCCSRIATSGPR